MAKPDQQINIALIGCGKMGSAMLNGWLVGKIVNRIYVLDPVGLPDEFAEYAPNPITYFDSAEKFAAHAPQADICVLAVKPQIMDDVCKSIAPTINTDTPVLSIAAGQSIGAFESYFGTDQSVIRAMPNTPASIGKGITVATANDNVSEDHKSLATSVLQSVGAVEWLYDESLMDAVTAVSGSGPAYIFYLIEALAKAGEQSGLNPDFAMKLARQTVIGAAALAEAEPEIPAAKLRENVTSPGGTTAAALEVLMNSEWQDTLTKAVAAATKRGKELGS